MPLSRKWKFSIVGISTLLFVVLSCWGIGYYLKFVRGKYPHRTFVQLDTCYRGMADKIIDQGPAPDGGKQKHQMLPGMAQPVCPPGGLAGLSKEPQRFRPEDFLPGGPAQVLDLHGMFTDKDTWACLQYTTNDKNDLRLREGAYFVCHAWTDLDDDGQIAHWEKRVIYQADSGTFTAGHVWHDDQSGDW